VADQLGLDLEPQPKAPRAAVLRHAYLRAQPVPAAEALALEARAMRQDTRVLAVFRPGRTLTPSQVHGYLCDECGAPAPLLTSIRRALTNLTRRGLLVHYPRERRDGPRGSTESTWGLA